MSEGVLVNLDNMRCPKCKSFHIQSAFGDVPGYSALDAWAALSEPKPYRQEFTVKSWHRDECRSCGYRWNERECDSLTLYLDARKPTLIERIKGWLK